MSCNLDCKTHKGSPIMFVCLDNQCSLKLYCFKCCQEHRKQHSFIKFTDFMHNLEYYLSHDFQGDSSHHNINSTQQSEVEVGDLENKKVQDTAIVHKKPSICSEDSLIVQCVKGINPEIRNGKVQEECEQAKDGFKVMQIQYIEELFEKQVSELIVQLQKSRDTIISKYIEYIDVQLNQQASFNRELQKKAIRLVLEANSFQSDNFQPLNESIAKLHSGEVHISFLKEKIIKKVGELNVKLDEFFAQIQNRITFSQNACTQIFSQEKQVNSAAAAVISKIFGKSQTCRNQPGEYRFTLRQQPANRMYQSQFTQQNSLSNSGQSSAAGGLSSRISFRIKNHALKMDTFLSQSPPHSSHQQQQAQPNFKPNKFSQGNQMSPTKLYRNLIQEGNKSNSTKNQQTITTKGAAISIKQSAVNSSEYSRGEEDKELTRFQALHSKDEQIACTQETTQSRESEEQSIQQKKISSNPIIQIHKSENIKNLGQRPSLRVEIKSNQTTQLHSTMSQDTNLGFEHSQAQSATSGSPSSSSYPFQQTSSANSNRYQQTKILKKSPKNINLINHKIGVGIGEDIKFYDDNFVVSNNLPEEENSKMQEKRRNQNAQSDLNANHHCLIPDHINKYTIFKQANQIKNVVEVQKQQIQLMKSLDNNSHLNKPSDTKLQPQEYQENVMSTLLHDDIEDDENEVQLFNVSLENQKFM